MHRKPVIGITSGPELEEAVYGVVHRYRVSSDYTRAVEAAGGIPIILPLHAHAIAPLLDLVDGVIFSGGADLDPGRFGDDAIHPDTYGVDKERDDFELDLIRAAVARETPVLCICRGIQVMNVAWGGTLIQHIPDEVDGGKAHRQYHLKIPASQPSHDVLVTPGSQLEQVYGAATLRVNSLHHQSVREPGDAVRVDGISPDGVIEAMSIPSASFALGVQWHPEMMYRSNQEQLKPFEALVTAVYERNFAAA